MDRLPTTLTKSAVTLTNTNVPISGRHPLWRPGTKFILDFSDNLGAISLADGGIPTGSTVNDLGLTPSVGTFNTTAFSFNAAKKALVSSSGSTAQRMRLGSAGQFAIPVDHEFLFIIWLNQTAAAAAPNSPICYLGPEAPTNGSACQVFVSTGSGGNTIAIQTGTGTSVRSQSFAADAAAGAATQLALRYDPTVGVIQSYINGNSNGTSNPLGALDLPDGSAMYFDITARFNGLIYCVQLVDLTEAAATEALWGYTADQILDGTDHVLADYQFGTGALAAAPRPAYIS